MEATTMPFTSRLDVSAVSIVGIAGETAGNLDWIGAAGQDGNAVPALLAMPDPAIPKLPQRWCGKFLVRSLQLLQAHNVWCGFSQPAQQHGQSGIDPIDVEGRYPHPGTRFSPRRTYKPE